MTSLKMEFVHALACLDPLKTNSKIMPMIQHLTEKRWICLFFILFLTFVAYSNIFYNEFVMDDFDFLVDRPLIRDLRNISNFFVGYTPPQRQEGIYSPFQTLFFAITYHLFKLDPFGHHLVSLLIHFAGIFFVFQISYFLTRNNLISFLCGLFFALHPVQVESITSITASIDRIGIVFLFAAFLLYIKAWKDVAKIDYRYYAFSFVCAIVAVFTYELALSLPFLFLWYDVCFLREKKSAFKIFLSSIPFFVLAVFYALSKFLVLGTITRGSYLYDSFYLTMLVIIKSMAKYVTICFLPIVLAHNQIISPGIFSFGFDDFDRYAVLAQSFLEPRVLVALLLLGLIFYAAFRFFQKNPLISFCIGWFFISLLPVSNIVPSSVLFGERYLYSAIFGFCLLVGLFLNHFMEREFIFLKLKSSSLCLFLICLVSIFYIGRVWIRNQDWKNDLILYQKTVQYNPYSADFKMDLGIVYTQYLMPQKAIKSFQEALKIRPDDPEIYFAMADAYMQLHQNKNALDSLKKAVVLNPEYAEAYYNMAGIYAFWGFKKQAQENLNLSVSYYQKQGRIQEAEELLNAFYDYFGPLSSK